MSVICVNENSFSGVPVQEKVVASSTVQIEVCLLHGWVAHHETWEFKFISEKRREGEREAKSTAVVEPRMSTPDVSDSKAEVVEIDSGNSKSCDSTEHTQVIALFNLSLTYFIVVVVIWCKYWFYL